MTRYAIADDAGLILHCGPCASFPTKTQALLFLLTIPGDAALDLHVVELDHDPTDLPPLPPTPRHPA